MANFDHHFICRESSDDSKPKEKKHSSNRASPVKANANAKGE